ncbi:SRPBCC domain-containing protein [Arthrobacter sp. I3]|uniref:SRPBCC domain-containing protein n=1 Tax=Arthrobacter sp. I3 TaxID=218158 RepID=UPI0009FF75F1|nr:SRPBCC domain-containing protein [Arthrobacter sp. I3]MCI9870800.1 SRPBCC domain-containing protein [Arthrobacter humicola]
MAQPNSVIGSIRSLGDGKGAVRMDSLFGTPATDLWTALTDPTRLARWVARVDGDLHPGGAFTAVFTSGWEGAGRVELCEAPRRLTVTMSPGSEEETVIEAVLTPEGPGTRLIVEERGLPLGEIAAYGAGWQVHIEDLISYEAGLESSEWRSRWIELNPVYEARYRLDA